MKTKGILILTLLAVAALTASVVLAQTRAKVVQPQTISTASPTPTPSPKPPSLQEEEGIIRVDTELVNLNVRVVDRNGRPVNNLQKRDFKVFEEGQPQQIEYFSKSEIPTNYTLVVDNSGSLRQQLDK